MPNEPSMDRKPLKDSRTALLRYSAAILVTVVCTLLSLALSHFLTGAVTLLLYVPAVMIAAWLGGLGPGLLSAFLSVALTTYFFLEPKYEFSIRRADDTAEIVVFSFVAFLISLLHTAQKKAQQALLDSKEKIRLIVDGGLDGIISLDRDGKVTQWNPQAEQMLGWKAVEAVGQEFAALVFPMIQQESLKRGLEEYLRNGKADILNRRMEMTGVRRNGVQFPIELVVIPIRAEGSVTFSAFVRDITERAQHESAMQSLHRQLQERNAWLSLVFDVTRAANEAETVDHAFAFAIRRICEEGSWMYAHVYLPEREHPGTLVPSVHHHSRDRQRFRVFRAESLARPLRKGVGIGGRCLESGAVEWAEDIPEDPAFGPEDPYRKAGARTVAAFPVRIGHETIGVFEYFSLEGIPKSETLVHLMGVVGLELGRVVERQRLQEDYSEAVWEQQRVIAQELHDGLGQELTGLGFLSQSLTDILKEPEEIRRAGRLTDGLKRALEHIRGLARGVSPVAPEPDGLTTALGQLAESTAAATGIACRFDSDESALVESNTIAVHLFRIPQEAVTNASKHSRPGRIILLLDSSDEGLSLTVADDVIGLGERNGNTGGGGFRIMRYRAAAIGASLRIEPAEGGGTRVTCILADLGTRTTARETPP